MTLGRRAWHASPGDTKKINIPVGLFLFKGYCRIIDIESDGMSKH